MMAAPTANEYADSYEVFDQAIEGFRASLSDAERSIFIEYADPAEMIKSIKKHCDENRKSRKLGPLCEKIHRFSEALAPFFDIINIFIQSHPEYSAIAWGAVRLVFMLSSNYTTFFEKLSAMFEKISSRLPLYHEHYNQYLRRRQKDTSVPAAAHLPAAQTRASPFEPSSQRIVRTLSLLYADIIQFCQEACSIFSNKKGGIRRTSSIIRDLFWTPFDSRFSKLLDRLQAHQELFESEMSLDNQKSIEERLCRTLKTVLTLNEKVSTEQDGHEKSITEAMERQKQDNARLESSIIVHFSKLEEGIRRIKERQNSESAQIVVEEMNVLKQKTDEIRAWIKAPNYMTRFENARRTRLSRTCEWFLKTDEYLTWKDASLSSVDPLEPFIRKEVAKFETPRLVYLKRHLVVRAKPGFGKTILSSLIIEDLQSQPIPLTGDLKASGSVAFFHFDSGNSEAAGISQAFRSILAQLFHQQRHEKHLVDAMSLLMESSSSGLADASDDEIEECLRLFLSIFPGCFVVVDGIDEYQDPAGFISRFYNVCEFSETRTAILGRPNIGTPAKFKKDEFEMHLLPGRNFEDIQIYLRKELDDILDRYEVPGGLSAENISLELAARANGMFLWAYLMVHLLQSEALSPNERLEAINETSLVDGLEDLYSRILSLLERANAKGIERASQIFGIVAAAPQPLDVSELKVLAALRPGCALKPGDIIEDLEKHLSPICGALVEVLADAKVQFIHSSVRECLASNQTRLQHPSFQLDISSAHARSADLCLTYLLYVAPSGPLSGFADRKANRDDVCALLPLFRYSLYWSFHAEESLLALHRGEKSCSWYEFETRLTTFLKQCLTVTTWIEGQWFFNMRHGLDGLHFALKNSLQDYRLVHSELTGAIGQLLTDLDSLSQSWAFVLKVNPNEIWGHSVTAYSPSSFWYKTPETEVTFLGRDDTKSVVRRECPPICEFSQLSSDGSCVGQLSIIPTKAFLDAFKRSESSHHWGKDESLQKSSEWIARYQIWSVRRKNILVDIAITIPEEQVAIVLQTRIVEGGQRRLLLPVALSTDLRYALAFSTIIKVLPGLEDGSRDGLNNGEKYSLQTIDMHMPQRDRKAVDVLFSPDSKYLAICIALTQRGGFREGELLVWHDEIQDGQISNFKFRGKAKSHNFLDARGGCNKNFAFHPHLPFLVFGGERKTYVWHLQHHNLGMLEFQDIFENALCDIGFVNDTGQASSVDVSGWFIRILDEPFYTSGSRSVPQKSEDTLVTIVIDRIVRSYENHYSKIDNAQRELGHWDQPSPATIPQLALNNMAVSQKNVDSSLLFSSTNGSVYDMFSREITQLPQTSYSTSNTTIALLPSSHRDVLERLVWTRGPQHSYRASTSNTTPDVFAPAIIERRRAGVRKITAAIDSNKRVYANDLDYWDSLDEPDDDIARKRHKFILY